MGLRRDGREAAIQFLYQFDTHKPAKVDVALAEKGLDQEPDFTYARNLNFSVSN